MLVMVMPAVASSPVSTIEGLLEIAFAEQLVTKAFPAAAHLNNVFSSSDLAFPLADASSVASGYKWQTASCWSHSESRFNASIVNLRTPVIIQPAAVYDYGSGVAIRNLAFCRCVGNPC